MVCSQCGTTNPVGAKFCSECGSPLGAPRAAAPAEERRVVSILFVDLVGFTERSDRADPEDVRRTLVPFHERVKVDLERFGGTLDKFIGDAVMGVFGAPVAHEDDPVRAVRSALKILDSMEELRRDDPALAVRIAVNTGEAVVTFGTGPQVGEAVAGDVVNTASRMQSLAPHGSVVVGETTMRAIEASFDVEPLPAAVVKGKAEPLSVWRVAGERESAASDVAPATFVGREQELALLRTLFGRAVTSSTLQLIALIAEPGIGKSRLVDELRSRIDDARWLSGRSLPYGEEIAFVPFAEIVRSVAGGEDVGALARRIEADASERSWLQARLEILVGAGRSGGDAISSAETARVMARVLTHAAGGGPLVVRLEDLHWAEDALIEAVGELAAALAERPVLLLLTARPEFLERHPSFAAGQTNTTTIELERLSASDTGRLITELLADAGLSSSARADLVERAGGNPLYALEFARMLRERMRPGEDEEMPLPGSVRSVIAARLDAIPAEQRSVVLDASVVGTSVWAGALAELSERDRATVERDVADLVRRGLFAEAHASAFDGEREYAFTHSLIREVAYARIPRGQRARRHLAAGRWMERAGGERADDRAEVLARHFSTAVDLAQVAGERQLAESARAPAVQWLLRAAERTGRLDAGRGFALSDHAVRIAPSEAAERAVALTLSAQLGRQSGELDGAAVFARYEESREIYRTIGDRLGEGSALTRMGSQAGAVGDTARSRDLLREAVEVLETEPPGTELARAYAFRAEEAMFAGKNAEAIEDADRALALVDDGAGGEIAEIALHIRGDARSAEGDLRGMDDLQEALRIARRSEDAMGIAVSETYLAEWDSAIRGPAAGLVHYLSALSITERRGLVVASLWAKAGSLGPLFDLGEWDRLLGVVEEMLAQPERLDGTLEVVARATRSRVAVLRGRVDAADDAAELVAAARPLEELHVVVPALVAAAAISLARDADAGPYLKEFAEITDGVASQYRESQMAEVVRLALRVGETELARGLVADGRGLVTRDRLNVLSGRASTAEATGERDGAATAFAEAADGWHAFGNPYEEAQALLGLARCSDDGEDERRRGGELLAKLGVRAEDSQRPS